MRARIVFTPQATLNTLIIYCLYFYLIPDDETFPDDIFCPFLKDGTGEDSGLEESVAHPNTDLDKSDVVEQMMKLASLNGGKCPLFFNQSAIAKRLEESPQNCPFNFGLHQDADSEDEADVPRKHKTKESKCPMIIHRTCNVADTKEADASNISG